MSQEPADKTDEKPRGAVESQAQQESQQNDTTDRGGSKQQQEPKSAPLENGSQPEVASGGGEAPLEKVKEPADDAASKGSTLESVSLAGNTNITTATFATCGGADLESARKQIQKPAALKSLRYYIMLLALVSPFIVTYSRTIINFAIIDMIDPNYLSRNKNNNNNNQALAKIASEVGANETDSVAAAHQDYFDLDNSCPVDESVRDRLLIELRSDERRAIETVGEKFQWDTDKQGYLKAAYAMGHMLLQVAGGRLSEIYGSQFIMSLSACLMAVCCLSAPFLASTHFYLLFADLFVLGILGSFMTPSLITLISNWLTPGEKSLMMSFYLVSSRLGYALSSLLCGLLIDAHLSWRYLFYSAGWVSLAFGNVFFLCSRNRPHEHPLMGQAELDYLASKNKLVREAIARQQQLASKLEETEMQPVAVVANGSGQSTTKPANNEQQQQQHSKPAGRPAAPWGAILTNAPVWAFIVTKFCVKLMGDTVQTELPVYLKRVMHMESRYNGYINSANYVIFCVSCVAVGTLAKWANKQRPFGWSKTTVRKIFQSTASFGVSLVLLGVSFSVCDEYTTLGLFMTMFFLTTFSTGGEAQIPLDLSERYAGTIHALGGTLAISGAIEPIMVGQFLLGHGADRARWANIWLGASGISFLGGLIFLTLGDAKIQPFDEAGDEHAKSEATKTIENGEKAERIEKKVANGHTDESVVVPTAPEESAEETTPN